MVLDSNESTITACTAYGNEQIWESRSEWLVNNSAIWLARIEGEGVSDHVVLGHGGHWLI